MIQWLYRYIFKGTGILMLIGMITVLFLAVKMLRQESQQSPGTRPAQSGTSR